jgi:hypothetical protein
MEIDIPWELETPAGTIRFVRDGDGMRVRDVAGMDGAQVRAPISSRPQRDGAILHDFWRGARYPILTVVLLYANLADRREAEDTLRAYTNSILKEYGTLRFTPNGAAQRELRVRLMDALQIGNSSVLKVAQISFVAPDPLIYSVTTQTTSTSQVVAGLNEFQFAFSFPFSFGTETSGGNVEAIVGGTAPTWPTVTITGPCSSPTVRNDTTGKLMTFPGLTVSDGSTVVIDTSEETVLLGGSASASVLRYIDPAVSEFWQLEPGPNAITFLGGGVGTAAKATVSWADAYV